MPPGNYRKPPITEAVIEIKFDGDLSADAMKKFVRAVQRKYPTAEETYRVSVALEVAKPGASPKATPEQKFDGFKLTGSDVTDVTILNANSLIGVRLAPYTGWDRVIERVKDDYAALKKIAGFRAFTRVATRYINRIDVPKRGREHIVTTDYVVVQPSVPNIFSKLSAFSVHFEGSIPGIDGPVIIHAATVQSPLIDHFSISLDINVIREKNIPQKEADLWSLLTNLRRQKDEVFEAFITDESRELFDHA